MWGEHSEILSTFIKLPLSWRWLLCLFLSGHFTQVLLYFLWSTICSYYSWSLFRYFALYKGLLPKVLRLGPGKLYSSEIGRKKDLWTAIYHFLRYIICLRKLYVLLLWWNMFLLCWIPFVFHKHILIYLSIYGRDFLMILVSPSYHNQIFD